MTHAHHYAFNGDADGLCALQQLRLADPAAATLVTGVKRDIQLLERVVAGRGDHVTVLDISLDSNRDGLMRLLDAGASVRYFDHHHAGTQPVHERFESHIDTAGDVCTSVLVDRHLGGRHRAWAITAAFGDSLPLVGKAMAQASGLGAEATARLERLGIALNYNAYGEQVCDLHFDPARLADAMLPYVDPASFIAESPVFEQLWAGYESDMAQARSLRPERQAPGATLLVMPDAAWARRAIGVLANDLMHSLPGSAIAILSPRSGGGYTVSVRVPKESSTGADEFCRQFPTGGGRRGAAGVNDLPAGEFDRFVARFEASFARS
ncbi:MAG TPA: DHHA1 domain-containing protein [Burkholderiaceae bacterium]|nr:DHHA1 domain-containing protein [Burkholderiaceae bacterium]